MAHTVGRTARHAIQYSRWKPPTMRVFKYILFTLCCFTVTGIAVPVKASPPTERMDCAVGWFDASIETSRSLSPIDPLDTTLSTRGGEGSAINCAVRIHSGLYAYGEVGKADAHVDVSLTLDDETSVGSFDLDAEFQRIGLGYVHSIADQLSLYGQIGYLNSDYDFEPIFVILESGAAQFGPADLRNDSDGLDFEGGLTWTASDRLELGAFARFAEQNSLAFGGDGETVFALENEDDFRIGARIRFQLAKPVHFAADAEFGDMDTLFLGLGVHF